MTTPRGRVLLTGLEETLTEQLGAELLGRGLGVHVADWEDAVLDLVRRLSFAGVVAAYPLPGAGFGILLSALRASAMASRHAALVAVAAPGRIDEARRLISHGVNRVVAHGAGVGVVLGELLALLETAPRVPAHVPARFVLPVTERPVQVLYQTENISASGMLVRGRAIGEPGTRVEFQLQVPGEEEPVRGVAEIARKTDPEREGIQGFGARFVALAGSDHERLSRFLKASVSPDLR